jgi:hypothetical protein
VRRFTERRSLHHLPEPLGDRIISLFGMHKLNTPGFDNALARKSPKLPPTVSSSRFLHQQPRNSFEIFLAWRIYSRAGTIQELSIDSKCQGLETPWLRGDQTLRVQQLRLRCRGVAHRTQHNPCIWRSRYQVSRRNLVS